jgi:formyltetrahydrofolate deformylase
MPETATLLVCCPDQPGLVAKISNFIFQHHGNILEADQHTDLETGTFLARMEWDLDGFDIPAELIAERFQSVANEHQMTFEVHSSGQVPKIVIFSSKMLHCLQDLLLRRDAGEFEAEIALIVSNHPDAGVVAGEFGVPFLHCPIDSRSKQEQEEKQIAQIRTLGVELVVLARYMQILSQQFVAALPNRIINIHHSFLPAFVGAQPYKQAAMRGVKLIGATGHYVTMNLDEGPIIEQEVTRISHRDSLEDMMRKGRDLERTVLARSVRLHLNHRVLTYGNKTVVFE